MANEDGPEEDTDNSAAAEPPVEKPIDIYKDTPIRLLGYANEVGESFRPIIPLKLVYLSYAIATTYCAADTIDKAYIALKEKDATFQKTAISAADTLIWQILASVIVPGFVINRICTYSNDALKYTKLFPLKTRLTIIPFIGLGTIPFIIKPIDHLVDSFLDKTFRQLVK